MKEKVAIFRHEKMMGLEAAIDAWLSAHTSAKIRRITTYDWREYLTMVIAYEE